MLPMKAFESLEAALLVQMGAMLRPSDFAARPAVYNKGENAAPSRLNANATQLALLKCVSEISFTAQASTVREWHNVPQRSRKRSYTHKTYMTLRLFPHCTRRHCQEDNKKARFYSAGVDR